MTTMAFVYLASNAGWTFDDLALDIRTLARPGDRVVIVDHGSTDDTPARIGRFGAMEGWGKDVAVTCIITDKAGEEDRGIALNLALEALSTPDNIPERVAVFAAGSRISCGIFAAARKRAEDEDMDLLVFPLRQWSLDLNRVIDPPGHDDWPALPAETEQAHALRQSPAVTRTILRWSVLANHPALRAKEHCDSHSDLALVWTAIQRAKRIGVTTEPAGYGPHPPAPGWFTLIGTAEFIRQDPAATDWIIRHLPSLLAGISTATAAAITDARALTDQMPPLPNRVRDHILDILGNGAPGGMIGQHDLGR